MGETIQGLKRTSMCAQVDASNVGEEVILMGWAQKRRDLGGVIFVDLRDRTGIIQTVFDGEISKEVLEKAESIRSEFVLAIKGNVIKRDPATVNPKLKTGDIEVKVTELRILSKAETPPFYIEEETDVNEKVRLKYRYLDLRRPDMQKNLMLRHSVAKTAREFFDNNGFVEIETPMLTKSTPEGARDYLVPSRVHPGNFYALPQSPQLYKQILMLSGMDRYYQIVKCFRDEDLRADRQPEFTQIDVEMSFVDINDIIEINEKLVADIFKKAVGTEIKTPFVRIPYSEAMDRYGSDKPDTRFDLELVDISDIVKDCGFKVFADAVKNGGSARLINAKNCMDKFSRRDLDSLVEFVKIYRAKGMAWIVVTENELKSPITKFLSEEETAAILKKADAQPGDILLFVADKNEIVYDALGNLRLELAKRLELVDKNKFNFLWVTDFPLLEYDEEDKRYVAKHHPFTSPMDEDLHLLDSEPSKVRAKAYDIVLNGTEIGGGSIRIHSTELQQKMFETLGFSREDAWERFGFLMEAFKYGTPPHGGIAYGLDRLVMIIAGCDSIRDVIAFPKVQNASELMSGAPSVVEGKQLKELNIRLNA